MHPDEIQEVIDELRGRIARVEDRKQDAIKNKDWSKVNNLDHYEEGLKSALDTIYRMFRIGPYQR